MRLAIFFTFILSFSQLFAQDQMFDICPLKVGETVPTDNHVIDQNGVSHAFGDLVKDQKTILVFFRGGWCPYCTRHLSALQEVKDEFKELGYQLIAVSPDKFDTLEIAEDRGNTSYQLYSDSDVDLIESFGLGWKVDDANYMKYRDSYGMDTEQWSGETHHILPVPAVYIIKDGVVQYNYVNPNYSVRLKPETLRAILSSLEE